MSRYFFDIEDGRTSRDPEGTVFATLKAARTNAVRMLGQMLCDRSASFWEGPELGLTVRDDSDLTLMRLTVLGSLAPAAR